MLCVLPLFHVSAQIISTIGPLYGNGEIVLTKKFSSSNFWEIIDKYKVNIVNVVPTILFDLLNKKGYSKYAISSLDRILCGAAPLPIEIAKRFEEIFKVPIVETYGLTEGTCCSCSNTKKNRKLGSIGLPLNINKVKIFDEKNMELEPNQIGEIVISGKNVFEGYLGMKEETNKIIVDGWLHSGDLGYKDESGYIFLTGRKKDIINRGGEKISPREIEEIAYRNPIIRNAVAVGIKDLRYGERIGLVIEITKNIGMNEKTKTEIKAYFQENLAFFKCPEYIFFIEELGLDSIPLGSSGKILRKIIADKVNKLMSENA